MSQVSRRSFVKTMAMGAAMSAASSLVPGVSFANPLEVENSPGFKWHKAPCRFCGVGCSVLVGVEKGKAVAVKGDPRGRANKGLCCVKGYHAVMALYGADRLTRAKVRKNGKLVDVPIEEALDLVASKMKQTIKESGKDAVSIYGSGQWTIPDGYVASKLMKGVIGTNNLEANARLCMASAVTGFLTSFGSDEPMGCYDDIDHADVFVLWGNNMAEMHPVLFSRLLERRLKNPKIKIISLETRLTRTGRAADKTMIFEPQTDLAIGNAISQQIIENKWVNESFVSEYTNFKSGKTDVGYGLKDKEKFKEEPQGINIKQFAEFLKDYTPEKAAELSGVSATDIKYLSSLYGDPSKKVMSFWCMGVNQHTRGTWMNNIIYNAHLLTGKISTPGNSPFSLTGQPSACGTVREVGTLTHKLPHGVVMKEKHREHAAKIWGVPVENIPKKPTYHTTEMFRAIDRGEIKFMWIQVTNPMLTMPNLNRYKKAMLKEDRFIVVSDIYETPTTDVADVILPSACWIEREGMFGNSERTTQHFNQLINPPGDAMSDTWQLIEVAKRMGFEKYFPWTPENHIEKIWNEYCEHQAGPKHGMAPYEVLKSQAGAQWPYVNGKSTRWRFNSKYDPACKNGKEFHFYGKPDGKAVIWQRPYQPAPEVPSEDYPFWLCTGRVIEHWHSGSMTRRIPQLHRAVPEAYIEIHPEDAAKLNINNGDMVKVSSIRGSQTLKAVLDGRGQPPKGSLFVPFFDENKLINQVTLDAFDHISKQPDYKKCAVKIEKA